MSDFDVAIIGAGIAGASLAAEIAAYRSVILIEAEDHPGYHSTGRSAAFWDESYGGPGVQPLTTASGRLLAQPPADFYNGSFLRPRGALYLGTDAHKASADRFVAEFADSSVDFSRLAKSDLEARVSGILPAWTIGLWQPRCADIDVGALHAAYLKRAKQSGGRLERGARLEKADWRDGRWHIAAGTLNCTADMLVNAAGAWADDVAACHRS
jgi:D-arginine dehydrogenase